MTTTDVACPACGERVAVPIALETNGGEITLTPDLATLLAHDETHHPVAR